MPPGTDGRQSSPVQPKTGTGLSSRLFEYWFAQPPTLQHQFRRALGPVWLTVLTMMSWFYRLIRILLELWHATISRPRHIPGVYTVALGNLIVGGAGKTPCALALAAALTRHGITCGLISRGYGSKAEGRRSQLIHPADLTDRSAAEIGDEAWLLCWRTQVPIAVGKNRLQSLSVLHATHPEIQVAILDDGLQQRSLQCDLTVLVVDDRGFGNKHCLPLGPLREPVGNLKRFDAWVANGAAASITAPAKEMPAQRGELRQSPSQWVCVDAWQDPQSWLGLQAGIARFADQKILAVAGIAVPQRFFDSLLAFGLTFDAIALPDHDPEIVGITLARWESGGYTAVLMTEKDAVKFFHTNAELRHQFWALRQEPVLDEIFIKQIINSLPSSADHGSETS